MNPPPHHYYFHRYGDFNGLQRLSSSQAQPPPAETFKALAPLAKPRRRRTIVKDMATTRRVNSPTFEMLTNYGDEIELAPAPAPGYSQDANGNHSSKAPNLEDHMPLSMMNAATKIAYRRRASILAKRLAADSAESNEPKDKAMLRKQPRRRTIYIPEDTTVMTIHPGASLNQPYTRHPNSPDTTLDLDIMSGNENATTDLTNALKVNGTKRSVRKSLSVAPRRRMPLADTDRHMYMPEISEDIPGQMTGKENLPLGQEKVLGAAWRYHGGRQALGNMSENTRNAQPDPASNRQPTVQNRQSIRGPIRRSFQAANVSQLTQTSAAQRRISIQPPVQNSQAARPRSSLAPPRMSINPLAHSDSVTARSTHELNSIARSQPIRGSSSSVMARARERSENFPILTDDIAHPELYEEHWLDHQEIAITQLLNSIFDNADPIANDTYSHEVLRAELISIYNGPRVPLLQKRIQAALMYGTLRMPKEIVARSVHLREDVGQHRKFLSLWVETYDLPALRAAAEAIVGRDMKPHIRTSDSPASSGSGDRFVGRKTIESFIDAFFIKHDDVEGSKATTGTMAAITQDKTDGVGSLAWAWRRTVIRSMMLVLVLDNAKVTGAIKGCLFQVSSQHKSSADVLRTLTAILLPSFGDILRPAQQLSYSVSAVQVPLEEYVYHVENLAIDLRDGIRLTRLIELLLAKQSIPSHQDETLALRLPDGEPLFGTSKSTTSLSSHLKLPCNSRTQKLYNIHIALGALSRLVSIPQHLISNITAEAIVDGHREKTLSLLWALLGRHSMRSMVDFEELRKEIILHEKANIGNSTAVAEIGALKLNPKSEDCWNLLFLWAKAIAVQKGLVVTNLTTSFSNPAVLEAIVDSYRDFLPTASSKPQTTTTFNLAQKLQAIGCSTSFTNLFTPIQLSSPTIPTRDFTLTTLIFLASRLLPLARLHRAATRIQRAHRRYTARRRLSRRLVLMRLASDCARIVRARELVETAAVVLQRAWRAVLDRRITMLVADVVKIQSSARGFLARKTVRKTNTARGIGAAVSATTGGVGSVELRGGARAGW